MRNIILAASAALLSLAPLAASAQDVPSYAQGSGGGGDEQIRGRVVAFDGAYSVQVSDDRGYTDNVQLHQGTIINPTGITIAPGMVVSILGYNGGNVFEANEVDTPYTYYGGEPYYGGHPWNYYGPTIGLDFFFGNVGWWHGSDFSGGYRYDRGARVYSNVNVTRIYNNYNGRFNGRNYVAPASHGGYVAGRSYNQSHGNGNVNHTTNVYAPRTTNVTNQHYTHVYSPQTTHNTGVTHNYTGATHTYTGATHTYTGATHANVGATHNYAPQTTHNYAPHVYNGAVRTGGGAVHTQVVHTGGGHPGGGMAHVGGAGGAGGGHEGGGHPGGGGQHR